MKVVVNRQYGGFELSKEAQKMINAIGCEHSAWIDEDEYFGEESEKGRQTFGAVCLLVNFSPMLLLCE